MRTIKELLILLREELPIRINHPKGGSLCWTIANLWIDDLITDEEYEEVNDYIYENKPEDAWDYCVGDDFDRVNGFWWPYGELEPRLEFLDKLINEIDEN